jgi:hypothetical protein
MHAFPVCSAAGLWKQNPGVETSQWGILDVGCAEEFGIDHGLINYIDAKEKCRHLKIDL